MTWGVDYPWTHPTAAALQASGAAFAMRYLSTDASKNLSRAEADDLAAHGIWCGVVWETTTGRALAGQAAGAADARTAAAQAAACGMPADRPIYFAVDTDTSWASVQPYFAGVASVLGATRTGVYGGLHVVQGAAASGLVTWYWQTSAWSGGVWDPRAHLRQGGGITIGGVDCDRNTATTTDYGQWMPGRTLQEDDMPLTDDDVARVTAAVAAAITSQPVRDTLAYAAWYKLQPEIAAVAGQVWESPLPQVDEKWQESPSPVPAKWLMAGVRPLLLGQAAAAAASGADPAVVQAAIDAAAAKFAEVLAQSTVHVQVDVNGTTTPATPSTPTS